MAQFCNPQCRRRERSLRDDEQGTGYIKKGYRPRPGARRHSPGETFGQLVLVEYVDSDRNGSRVLAQCTCGEPGEYGLRNLTSGATTKCVRCTCKP